MGTESNWIGGELHRLVANHVTAGRLGWTFPADAGFQCSPMPPTRSANPTSRSPPHCLPAGPPKGHCRVAPDLAVEVISPNELYSEVEEKIDEYLAAGVRLVWVVDPPHRSVRAPPCRRHRHRPARNR